MDSYLRQGGEPPDLASALKHVDPGVRSRAALLSASQLEQPEIKEALVEMLSDRAGVARAAAVVALSGVDEPKIESKIEALSNDKESCLYPIKFIDLHGKTQRLPTPELPGRTVAEVVAKYRPR